MDLIIQPNSFERISSYYRNIQNQLKENHRMTEKIKPNSQPPSSKKKNQSAKYLSPIHKEFQFMYRSCDRLPSSEQYESVIFMKHQKISSQNMRDKNNKRDKKGKNDTTKRQNKCKRSPQNKKNIHEKEEKMGITKSTAPFSCTNGNSESQGLYKQGDKKKERLEKLSPELKSKSTKYDIEKKTKEEKKQKQIKKDKEQGILKNKGKKLKSNKRQKTEAHEFIVIENSFIQIEKPSIKNLEDKLQEINKAQENKVKSQIERLSANKQNKCSEIENQPIELESVRRYITEKVLIIQRWWRKIKGRQAVPFSTQKTIEETNNQNKEDLSIQWNKNDQIVKKLVQLRELTALNHMKSQKKVIDNLFENDKISHLIYNEKITQIENQFQNQMLKISRLKQILVENTERIKELQQKIQSQTEITKNIQFLSLQSINQQLFPEQTSSNGLPYNRKKATGCHFTTFHPDKITYDLYRKNPQKLKEELFNENDSDDQNQGKQKEDQIPELLQYYNDRQKVQNEIQKRHAIQIGIIKGQWEDKTAINSSVVGVHTFLINFLKFYAYFYKDEFLKVINMPYGLNIQKRLASLQGYEINDENSSCEDQIVYGIDKVIGDEILQDFHEHNYESEISDTEKIRLTYEKYHHQAIVHAFNEVLNCFRPYFYINGAPYPWNYNEKALTFYFVGEQNIQEVFDKTQYKILKWCSSLCGLLCNELIEEPALTPQMSLHEALIEYRNSVNVLLSETREQKLTKVEKEEIEKSNYQWFMIEENYTDILLEISSLIFEEMLFEAGICD